MEWIISSTSDQKRLPIFIKAGSIVLVGTLITGELTHAALPPHAAPGYEEGDSLPREKVVTVVTTSSANSPIGTDY